MPAADEDPELTELLETTRAYFTEVRTFLDALWDRYLLPDEREELAKLHALLKRFEGRFAELLINGTPGEIAKVREAVRKLSLSDRERLQ